MAKTQTQVVLIAAGTVKTAGTPVRGRADVSMSGGGVLTMLITNGATAPTNAGGLVGRMLIAHAAGSMPVEAGPGAAWKLTNVQISGGTVGNAVTALMFRFGPEIPFIEVEYLTHIGADVTVEAYVSYFVNA